MQAADRRGQNTTSTYFSLITGGRYPHLVADEADGNPVLRAERDDGVLIGVEAMSEETADQLYLVLRLTALELRRASHPQMPLVLDDVLITSDGERAANILRAHGKFSEGGAGDAVHSSWSFAGRGTGCTDSGVVCSAQSVRTYQSSAGSG